MHHADPSRRIRSISRLRKALAIATVVVPLALSCLFERQARRLDALAARGMPAEAVVTAIANGGTFYAYRVGGEEYTWNVARDEAPFAVGQRFPIVYLPDVPSFSRPIADRRAAADEATRGRSFAWKVALGVALMLAVHTIRESWELRRARAGAPAPEEDRAGYRQRVGFFVLALVPMVALISEFHLSEAVARGTSPAVAAIPGLVSVAILGGIIYLMARGGPAASRERAARVARWVVPIGVGLAILRLVLAIMAS